MNEYISYTIARIEQETELVKSFYLKRTDGKTLEAYKPGQFLQFRLPIEGQYLLRFYTISDCYDGEAYRVSVKLELSQNLDSHPHGLGSCYFHALEVGDKIEAKGPAGDFCINPKDDHPITFIAGGIGITPILSMLNAIAKHNSNREVNVLLAMQNTANYPFQQHVSRLVSEHQHFNLRVFYDYPNQEDILAKDYDIKGRITINHIKSMVEDLAAAEYYICGPRPMMDALTNSLFENGVKKGAVHTEAFGPASPTGLTPDEEQAGQNNQQDKISIEFVNSGVTHEWDPSYRSILEFAESTGVSISAGCLFGDCGTCLTKVVDGDVKYNHPTAIEAGEGACLPCSCVPKESLKLEV